MAEADQVLLRHMRRRLGLTAQDPYARAVEERLARALAARGLRPEEALPRLAEDPELVGGLVEAVVVGETHFFREPERLRHLVEVAVPTLLRDRAAAHVPRIWSAGCSTGEEAFSLTILLHDAGSWPVEVLGTDVSSAALRHAAEASYGPWSFRGVGPAPHERHFVPDGDRVRVHPRIAERVSFAELNLASDPFPGPFDVIVCRNVLVYLDRGVQRSVVGRFATALASGGWLVTGVTDPVVDEDLGLERVRAPAGFFYRRPGGSSAMGGPRPSRATTRRAAPRRPSRPPSAPRRAAQRPGGAPSHAEPPGQPRSASGEIRALMNDHELDRAQTRVVQAVEESPLDPEPHYLRALLALERHRPEEAVAAAAAASSLAPRLAAVHVVLGQAQRAAGRPEKALRSWRWARTLLCAAEPAEPVPFTDGEPAWRILALLDALRDGPGGALSLAAGGRR